MKNKIKSENKLAIDMMKNKIKSELYRRSNNVD